MSCETPFWRRRMVMAAASLAALVLCAAAFAPFVAPHDPVAVDLTAKLLPPSADHWLGTDHLGRDVFSRLIWGARASLGSVAGIVCLLLAISTLIGCLAGYVGGKVDAALMRLCDVFLTFPTFILAMFLVGILGTGMVNVIIAIAMTHWAWYARIIRSLVLSLRNREYVLAARVAGSSRGRILTRHILPPVAAQLVVLATLDIGHMMLHVSGLSFLGLGVQPPSPEWGVMINDARQYIWDHPRLIILPGLMIFLSVMAFNLLGDALRDRLDPHADKGADA
ncbi:nickel ABC transporter permease subunit NikC [Alkalidesulfovibrio alkalitolerans]|nr:nickel ABC transporter permease subunit NikC [Alkalidesulfovibrio alkalitolerans]